MIESAIIEAAARITQLSFGDGKPVAMADALKRFEEAYTGIKAIVIEPPSPQSQKPGESKSYQPMR